MSIFLVLIITCSNAYGSTGSFYKSEDKYRGFYWFEDVKKIDETSSDFVYPTPEEAASAIESRKKALDDARAQMTELGFREDVPPAILRSAIVKYKKLESAMYDGAIRLTYASEMANFTNPEIANVIEFPTNVFANKIKRRADEKQTIEMVREFANRFDLLLFEDNNCPYCKSFKPVLTVFARDHGFSLETASLNSSEGQIAQNLGIKSVPTLIAVSKNGDQLFEISRGLSSRSELESSIVLSSKYSKEQVKTINKGNR